MPVKDSRVTKPKVKRTRVAKALPLVERTNALSIEDFRAKYATCNAVNNTDPNSPAVDLYSAATISRLDREACLDLIEQTSKEAYAASSVGWSRVKKREEMVLPDMKYLIVRAGPAEELSNREVNGFLSFMVTYEDGKEVVYCYEIHLAPTARGQGVGRLLMGRMEEIGRIVGLEKSMLTVFKSNERAMRFYERLGYGVDEYSPQPRRLRNGTVKESDYLILSKGLR